MTFSWLIAPSKVKYSRHLRIAILFGILFSFSGLSLTAQDAEVIDEEVWSNGKTLFRSNCGSCHMPDAPSTGPALKGAVARWEEKGAYQDISGKEWLYRWVKNNNEVRDAGHTYGVALFNEYNQSPMNLFPALTNEEIDAIFLYADNHQAFGAPVVAEGTGGATEAGSNFPMKTFLAILVAGLLGVVLVLTRVSKGLKRIAAEKNGEEMPQATPIWRSSKLKTLAILVGVILLGYFTVSNATALGRQEGYQPEQPIKYSHELHAGVYSIDCQYCHSSAAESKNSMIPSPNVCMNCHKNIKEGPEHGRKEISKIYAAIGFNPNDGTFFDTDKVSKDEVTAELRAYLAQDYSEEMSDEELAALKEDLATTMDMYNRPIQWVRIHNLPDHVYFNHAQHVTAGNVACQTCHGAIEEMAVVEQHAPLSMGWCINCHRQTEVDLGNEYYSVYEKYHEDLKSGAMDKVTVEDIGGTECQKCHY